MMKGFVLIWLFMLWASASLWAEIPASAWSALEKRFESVRADYESEEESLSKESEKKKLEEEAVAYLRSLLIYESAARVLGGSAADLSALGEIRSFSSREQSRVAGMREDVREAELELILTALADDTSLAGDEDTARSLLKDELRLDDLFKSKTRKQVSGISSLERELEKVKRKTERDDPRRQKLKDEIAQLKEEIAVIHEAVWGFRLGCGFRQPVDETLTSEAVALLTQLVAERERVYMFLRGEPDEDVEGELKGGVVGGSLVYSINLGIVLDNSGSMTEHLEGLRDEIADFFEAPRYREVSGCALLSSHFEHLRSTQSARTWATMSVIEELITVRRVDTVYWFSDLKDGQDVMSIRRLRELLKRGGTRLHVKSITNKPSRDLEELIFDFQD